MKNPAWSLLLYAMTFPAYAAVHQHGPREAAHRLRHHHVTRRAHGTANESSLQHDPPPADTGAYPVWPDAAPQTLATVFTPPGKPPDVLLVDASNAAYNVWLNTYTQRIYEHQDRDSTIIFIVVNLLVGCGLFFAWTQFRESRHGLAALRQAGEAEMAPELAQEQTFAAYASDHGELLRHLKGLTLRASVTGPIILGFSMGFYILYLKYGYPITNATPDDRISSFHAETPRAAQPSRNVLAERSPVQ